MSNNRIKKLNSLVKEELSKIIQKEVDFEEGTLVTIQKVEVSPDVAHANIHISVIPDDSEEKALETLKDNVFRLQQELNKKLILKKVPKVRFTMDDSIKRVAEMEKLFKKESSKNPN
ncbi:MAG: 30S ribosome-binding factor RbfA [Parcubacteria group bacterium]|nr:30S ribosome-binding factor RbfA [Parcubacteria group bacterium]